MNSFEKISKILRADKDIIRLLDKKLSLATGRRNIIEKITEENLGHVLSKHVGQGGLLIDLAWNIGATDIIGWCHDHNVLYVNTSVEVWDSLSGIFKDSPYVKSLYWRQMKLRERIKDWKDAPTAIVDHGANPGLISHFAKQGLLDIAKRAEDEKKVAGHDLDKIKQYNIVNFKNGYGLINIITPMELNYENEDE